MSIRRFSLPQVSRVANVLLMFIYRFSLPQASRVANVLYVANVLLTVLLMCC
jgi:hypothetical protein